MGGGRGHSGRGRRGRRGAPIAAMKRVFSKVHMATQGSLAGPTDPLPMALADPTRPCFLFGATPPREGTDEVKAMEIAEKFVARARNLATDGYIVYDIQEEDGRTELPRPFPFRRTLDPSAYGAMLSRASGKQAIIYKCAVGQSRQEYSEWLDTVREGASHRASERAREPASARARAQRESVFTRTCSHASA